MRNLKRVLSLALAAFMLMGMMIVGAGAASKDFTDADEITNVEAVDVMVALGVLEGGDAGDFQPNSILTREQAAKIICYMLLGKDSAEKLTTNYPIFSDVPANRWSAPFISYCVNLGILAGDGAGHFYPEGKLTGVAFAKMLMVCLGYSAERESYVGNDWEINTSAAAIAAGVAPKGLVLSEELSRQDAAQMAFNTLTATMVEYLNDNTIIIGGETIVSTVGKASAVKQYPYTDTMDTEYLQFAEKYFEKLKKLDDVDDFDRPAHTWSFKGEAVGTYVNWDEMVGEYTTSVTGKDLYGLLTASTIKNYGFNYYLDGKLRDDVIKASNMIRSNTTKYATTGNGVLTQVFVDDKDEEIVITSINTYLAEATADYNAKKETLTIDVKQNDTYVINNTLELDDFAAIANYKEGDMLRVCVAETTADKYDVIILDEPEVMSDSTVTKFSNGSYLVTGGEQYDYSKKGTVLNDLGKYYDSLLDNTYDVYLDAYGYVLGTVKTSGELKYLFLTGYDLNGSNLAVTTADGAAIFLDGTFEEIKIDVTDTDKNLAAYGDNVNYPKLRDGKMTNNEDGDSEYNMWFSYTVDDKGVYTLKPVKNFAIEHAEAAAYKINSAGVRVVDDFTDTKTKYAYGNDDSVYLTVDTGAVDLTTSVGITEVTGTYTGVQNVDIKVFADADNALTDLNTIKGESGYPHAPGAIFALYDEDLYIIGAVVVGEDANATENYAFAVKGTQNEYVDADGNYYWDFQAVVDNEVKTLTVKEKGDPVLSTLIANQIAYDKDAMFKLTYDTEGYVIDAVLCKDSDANVYGGTEFNASTKIDPDTHKIYDVRHSFVDAQLTAIGRTLYVSNKTAQDVGLTIESGALIVVVQRELTTTGAILVEEYTTFAQALDALEDSIPGTDVVDFKGEIAAVLNDKGTAEYVVLKSITPVDFVVDDGSSPVSDGIELAGLESGATNPAVFVNSLDSIDLSSGGYTASVTIKTASGALVYSGSGLAITDPGVVTDQYKITLTTYTGTQLTGEYEVTVVVTDGTDTFTASGTLAIL